MAAAFFPHSSSLCGAGSASPAGPVRVFGRRAGCGRASDPDPCHAGPHSRGRPDDVIHRGHRPLDGRGPGGRDHPRRRLFEAPWAAALTGPDGASWFAGRPPGSTLPIATRTRFFDDWLHAVAIEGGIRQVVLLAAGLDTRAYRLPWAAATTVFELDRPVVLAEKERTLDAAGAAPACDRRVVRADLAADWAAELLAAGLDRARPAARSSSRGSCSTWRRT
ncbi:MAG TPA: class I SAM-dependent methyltransferase [Candidatus Limnocylindrales bacterium]